MSEIFPKHPIKFPYEIPRVRPRPTLFSPSRRAGHDRRGGALVAPPAAPGRLGLGELAEGGRVVRVFVRAAPPLVVVREHGAPQGAEREAHVVAHEEVGQHPGARPEPVLFADPRQRLPDPQLAQDAPLVGPLKLLAQVARLPHAVLPGLPRPLAVAHANLHVDLVPGLLQVEGVHVVRDAAPHELLLLLADHGALHHLHAGGRRHVHLLVALRLALLVQEAKNSELAASQTKFHRGFP